MLNCSIKANTPEMTKFEQWMKSEKLEHLLDKRANAFDTALEYTSAGTQHRWLAWSACAVHQDNAAAKATESIRNWTDLQ